MNRRLIFIPLTVLFLAALSTSPSLAGAQHTSLYPTQQAIHDRLVDIGGRSLFLRCMGSGSPTVVLDDAGFVEAWLDVQPQIARFAHVCTYDREGLGLSDPGRTPTSSGQLARDLHALLRRAHLPGPYILVGHAFGGDTVRLYPSWYPQEVAGVVLVDAVPPEVLRHSLIPNTDDVNIPISRRHLELAGRLGALPLVVLTHGVPYSYPTPIEREWPRLQRGLAMLSTVHVVVTVPSGQNIPALLPEVVTLSVQQVLKVAAVLAWKR